LHRFTKSENITKSLRGNVLDSQCIFARSASAITVSEKSSIMTNRKSTTRFPMSLRLTTHVALSPQRWIKTQSDRMSSKNWLFRRKAATKFLYVKTSSGVVVRHSLANLNMHKWLLETPSHLPKTFGHNYLPTAKVATFNRHSYVTPQP